MYHSTQSGNSFFSMANGYGGYDEGELYSYASSSSPSASVDCTLSLGTPSTRGTNESGHEKKRSGFGWNVLSSKHAPPPSSSAKPHRAAASSSGGDPLLARRCANCDTTSTPLWRNGPRGPKSLCNACGIRYKKEERRAAAAAAARNDGAHYEGQYMMNGSCYSSGYGGEYRFMEDDDADQRDSEMGGGGSFMSWRYNVTDRSSFVHDFTR